jgi:hypothetical protein
VEKLTSEMGAARSCDECQLNVGIVGLPAPLPGVPIRFDGEGSPVFFSRCLRQHRVSFPTRPAGVRSIVAVGVHTIGSAAADHRDALSSSPSAEALLQLVPILSAALLPIVVASVPP